MLISLPILDKFLVNYIQMSFLTKEDLPILLALDAY